MKRVIVHPHFHNIGYKEGEKLLANEEQGDVIIRPSSKGHEHLSVSWKVSQVSFSQSISVQASLCQIKFVRTVSVSLSPFKSVLVSLSQSSSV